MTLKIGSQVLTAVLGLLWLISHSALVYFALSTYYFDHELGRSLLMVAGAFLIIGRGIRTDYCNPDRFRWVWYAVLLGAYTLQVFSTEIKIPLINNDTLVFQFLIALAALVQYVTMARFAWVFFHEANASSVRNDSLVS